MRDADRKELQRRLGKEGCTFTRMCGCYVDANKNKVTTFSETFLNLDDTEFYKFLDIAKEIFKGKLGDNLIELEFEDTEKQRMLENTRACRLKDDDWMDSFYDAIITGYDYVGNYLILLFHDVYDVITYTKNKEKLDESEDVFEYLLCAVCPVCLSTPGLAYNETENLITSRVRDWVVGKSQTGFIWPAFTDRQEDRDSVVFFTKDAEKPHKEFMTEFLGCGEKWTNSERRENFKGIIDDVLGKDTDFYGLVNDQILNMVEYPSYVNGVEQHMTIDEEEMHVLLETCGVSEEQREKVVKNYAEVCKRIGYPKDVELLDERAAKKARAELDERWKTDRIDRLKEYLKRALAQLVNPNEEKDKVCSSIAELLGEENV